VRTKTVKKASRVIIEKYYTRLGHDFHTNKRIASEVRFLARSISTSTSCPRSHEPPPLRWQIAIIPTKSLRNKIAGFITHLMKRIQKAPVRCVCARMSLPWCLDDRSVLTADACSGISIKLQQEERERRDNYVPDKSAIDKDEILIDSETKDMLRAMDFGSLGKVKVSEGNQNNQQQYNRRGRSDRGHQANAAPATN
jgi:small subunit ribosomal protein S17e